MQFGRGTRVSFKDNRGCKCRGRVTAVADKHRNVRTDGGHILKAVPVVRLKRARDDVLALETRLDASLGSDRQDGPFFEYVPAAVEGGGGSLEFSG